MELKKPVYTATWSELNTYIQQSFFNKNPEWQTLFLQYPLKLQHVQHYKNLGWKVSYPESFALYYNPRTINGRVRGENPYDDEKGHSIDIHPFTHKGYERDKILFHELCHLHYDFLYEHIIYDNLPEIPQETIPEQHKRTTKKQHKINVRKGRERTRRHEAIIEWLGRKHRLDYKFLRETIYTLDLEPKIYDLISYMAFGEGLTRFNKKPFKKSWSRICMD